MRPLRRGGWPSGDVHAKIACDGGEGALGHPRVWLAVPHDTGVVECGYCDKKYVHENFIEKLKG